MIHVLAVDDEPPLLRALVLNLTNRGYTVSTASTGEAAITQATAKSPDLMILDLGLPDIDGLEVIRHIHRLQPEVPIVVLSARTGSTDKVAALDLGAVDYVTKPFNIDELLARLRAVSRRAVTTRPTDPSSWVLSASTSPLALSVPLTARLYSSSTSRPPSGACWKYSSATRARSSLPGNSSLRCAETQTTPNAVICASICSNCAANSSRTPAGRVTCSPNPAWVTGTCRERGHHARSFIVLGLLGPVAPATERL